MPASEIPKKSYIEGLRKFTSKKVNTIFDYELLLISLAIELLKNDLGVVSFIRNTKTLNLQDEEGNQTQYLPKFKVVLLTGKIVHLEIRALRSLIDDFELFKKYKQIEQIYELREEIFILITCQDIRGLNPEMFSFLKENWFKTGYVERLVLINIEILMKQVL